MIGEEPPALPFPSHVILKSAALDILKLQKNPPTPDVEFRFFDPEQTPTEKKSKKPTNKVCDVCKRKKVKCDINSYPEDPCTRPNCQCLHHNSEVNSTATPEEVATPSTSNPGFLPNETIPSTTVFRKPGILYSGHYTGETSFCTFRASNQPPAITEEEHFPTFEPIPTTPIISNQDKLYLIDVYYTHLNPFYPILNKKDMLEQLDAITQNKPSYLSPLFFFALFARAAAHVDTTSTTTNFEALGQECLNYASRLVSFYTDKPRCSTILALVMMANHLEQQKSYRDLTKAWLWAGEAFRMALDLGIHRSFVSDESTLFGQLCIRTFWLAYIADCTISVTYGRPSSTEEKVLDVAFPAKIPNDDETTAQLVDRLSSLISLSKAAARIIKFSYCPPPLIIYGAVKRHNAFLVSVDSWLMDITSLKEPDSPISNTPNVVVQESVVTKRMNFQTQMFLYTNLILLHRPYVHDILVLKGVRSRPSFEICAYAAIMITDASSKLDTTELIYHSKSPMMAYALVMALRIHIFNATEPNPEKYNANKNFYICLETLGRLPQSKDKSSILYDTLNGLEEQYNNRVALFQESQDELKKQRAQLQSKMNQPPVTAAQMVFAPNETEKRKGKITSGRPLFPFIDTNTSISNSRPPIFKNGYHPTNKQKKRARTSHPDPFIHTHPKTQMQKQKQKQQKLQSVFPSSSKQQEAPKIQSVSPPQQIESQQQQQQQHQQPSSSEQFTMNDDLFADALQSQPIFNNSNQQHQYMSADIQQFCDVLFSGTVDYGSFSQSDYPALPQQTYLFGPDSSPFEPLHQFGDSPQLDLDNSYLMNWDFNQQMQQHGNNDMATYCVAPIAETMGVMITKTASTEDDPNSQQSYNSATTNYQ